MEKIHAVNLNSSSRLIFFFKTTIELIQQAEALTANVTASPKRCEHNTIVNIHQLYTLNAVCYWTAQQS
jgi:hypothetical protein